MTSSGDPRAAVRAAEISAAALAILLLVLGLSLWVLTTPAYVNALVRVVGSAEETGLGEQTTLEAAESVRRFVVDRDAPDLPEMIEGVPAFDAAAVSHLADVRDVVVPTRWLTLVLLVLVPAWAAIRWRTPDGRRRLSRAAGTASAALLSATALAILAGLLDFDALFAWFHSLFFAEGTWVFPYEALLIRVFPLRFWIAAGATWGVLVLIAAAFLCLFARRLRFTAGTYGV